MFHVWRAGCDGAPAQFQFQTEILDDLLRKQADQIGVTRQARVVIGKDLLRNRGAADVIIFFQQQHAQSSTRKIRRRHQAIVSGSKNYNVIFALDHAHARARARD
jgi:hypothetical protein